MAQEECKGWGRCCKRARVQERWRLEREPKAFCGLLALPSSALLEEKGCTKEKEGSLKGWAPASTSEEELRAWKRPDIPKFSGKETRKSDLEVSLLSGPASSVDETLAPGLPGKAQLCQGSHPQAPEESAASKCTAVLFLSLAMGQMHLLSLGPIQ